MTITEVRRILGRNSKEQRFGMTPNELTTSTNSTTTARISISG